jgi:hypothetical protein
VTDAAGRALPEFEPLFLAELDLEPLCVEGRVAVRRVPTATALLQGSGFRV